MDRELAASVSAWRIAGPELEAMRDRDLVATPLPEALDKLSEMIESAPLSPSATSPSAVLAANCRTMST